MTSLWTIVVDELDGDAADAERLRRLLVDAMVAAGQRPRTVTVESWVYRENTKPARKH